MKNAVVKRNLISNGFTLIELMVSIALMALMAGYFVYNRMEALKEQLAHNIAQQMLTIGNKASEYYAASVSNQWPDNDTSQPGCQDPVAKLSSVGSGYLPADYQVPAMLTFSCQSTVVGVPSIFEITAKFGSDSDTANLLVSMLPMAVLDRTDASNITVTYKETPPRILGQNYSFYKKQLNGHGQITVDIPNCATAHAEFIAIPQSVCSDMSHKDFAGYEFKKIDYSTADSKWTLQLQWEYIKQSTDTNGNLVFDSNGQPVLQAVWSAAPSSCNGSPVDVGVITYCGN